MKWGDFFIHCHAILLCNLRSYAVIICSEPIAKGKSLNGSQYGTCSTVNGSPAHVGVVCAWFESDHSHARLVVVTSQQIRRRCSHRYYDTGTYALSTLLVGPYAPIHISRERVC